MTDVKKLYILMAATVALMLTSCVQDLLTPEQIFRYDQNTLVFSVTDGAPATRAIATEEVVRTGGTIDLGMTEDGQPLRFVETVTNLNVLDSAPMTKGTPATTANVKTLYGSFKAVIFPGTSTSPVTNLDGAGTSPYEFTFSTESNKWTHRFSTNPWVNNDLYFFMYMPEPPEGVTYVFNNSASAKTISFNYTTPTAAADQKDLLFGGRAISKSAYNSTTGAPVFFQHALTGVKFVLGNEANNTVITSVTLKNVVGTGSAVVTPSAENENYTDETTTHSSQSAVVWSNLGDPTEEYTVENISAESLTFWLIPQTLTADAELIVTYKVNGGTERTLSAKINEGLTTDPANPVTVVWKAGELHTFTLNPNDVNVNITDTVTEGGVKNNVVITNTGNVPAYLRAVIIANWQDNSGHIVAAWDPTSGTFSGLPGSGWALKDDGFYYTTTQIAPGAAAPALFTSYTPGPAPVDGAHLVMDIAVQAVADNTVWE